MDASIPTQSIPTQQAPCTPLSASRVGDTGRVARVDVVGADGAYLRALGVRVGVRVRLARRGEPCIIEVLSCGMARCGPCGCRVGLSRELASGVYLEVEPAEESPAHSGMPNGRQT